MFKVTFATSSKIQLIKAFRAAFELPLKEAKDAFENGILLDPSELGIFCLLWSSVIERDLRQFDPSASFTVTRIDKMPTRICADTIDRALAAEGERQRAVWERAEP